MELSARWTDIVISTGIGLLAIAMAIAVDTEMADRIRSEFDEHVYHLEALDKKPLLWIEFAENQQVRVVDRPDVTVTLHGFTESRTWLRTIGWSSVANEEAAVNIYFPSGSDLQEAGLHFTDGNNLGRVFVLRTNGSHRFVEPGEKGRWVFLPVSADERTAGHKVIRLAPTTGSIALAAVIVTGPGND